MTATLIEYLKANYKVAFQILNLNPVNADLGIGMAEKRTTCCRTERTNG
ncbi:hypothetical protein [Aeromonas media]